MTRRPRLKSAPLILFVVAASVMVSCGHVNPTSPNDTPSASAVPPDATGQVVDIASVTNGISDVVISGVGAFRTRTDARGFFTLTANTSTYALLLTHPNFVERRTAAILPASGLHVSMIPSTFDQPAFEEFAPRATATGLRRWTENPSLMVLTNVVEYDGVAYDPLVTDRQVADGDVGCMRDGVQRAIAPMSDGVMTFKKVDVLSLPSGSRFSIPGTTEGTIVLVVAHGLLANGRASAFAGVQPNVLVRGVVWISADNLPLCGSTAARVYPHELGHALGYQHVTLEPSVMSGISPTSALTEFDREAIRIVYQRPPGNRTPDIDPPTYVIN
jgi:hypothetical protein